MVGRTRRDVGWQQGKEDRAPNTPGSWSYRPMPTENTVSGIDDITGSISGSLFKVPGNYSTPKR